MTIWVGLLRGVNVGRGNRLPMADFRTSVAGLGYTDVATYVQSGNVVFRDGRDAVGEADEATIAARLRAVLADSHGLSVPVVVRTAAELAAIDGSHPLDDGTVDPKLLHVAFLSGAPAPADIDRIDATEWLPDRWVLEGRHLFLAYPNGSARSKMTIDRFERAWGVTATARNLNTVARLVAMAGELLADRDE